MKRFLTELLWWALSIAFAGIMLVGFFAEFVGWGWFEPAVKLFLSSVGFVGCVWASNRTTFGRRICGNSF